MNDLSAEDRRQTALYIATECGGTVYNNENLGFFAFVAAIEEYLKTGKIPG